MSLTRWLQRLLHRARLERELDAELRDHVERQIADSVRDGMSETEARRRARLEFGGLDQTKDACRDARGTQWIDDAFLDIHFAIRLLAKDRWFTLVAVLALALGIGANTAMFSVIESVLLKPLPYRHPDRLVWISETKAGNGDELELLDGHDLDVWRAHARSCETVTPLLTGDATMSGAGQDGVQVRVAALSERLERIFGVSPSLGRDFLPQEFRNAPPAPGLRTSGTKGDAAGVAILSDLFYRRLGGRPGLLGAPIVIGRTPYTVIGVLPPSFRLPVAPSLQLGIGPQKDVDLILNTSVGPTYQGPGAAIARLKPGVPIETATAELETIRQAGLDPAEKASDLELHVTTFHDHIVGRTRGVLLVLWAAVGFVLLVACVNIVNLLLARFVAREHETAMRAALGASRWRLIRQMIVENAVLTITGGLAGVALAFVAVRLLAHAGAIDVPRLQDTALDWRVFAFCAAICATISIALGMVPALRSRTAVGEALKATTHTVLTSRSARGWQGALVIGELTLALIPLTGAGLMLRSMWEVHAQSAPLVPNHVLAAQIQSLRAIHPQSVTTPAETLNESDRMIGRIESLPAVSAAALWNVTFGWPARITDSPEPTDKPVAMWFDVSPRYQEASGAQLLAGRWLTERDRTATPPVVVVSQRFARRFATDAPHFRSIVGRTTFGPFAPTGSNQPDVPMTIIGVVSDFRSGRFGILQPDDAHALPQVFFSDGLRPMTSGQLLVRTASDPLALIEPVRKIVQGNLGETLTSAHTLAEQLSAAVAPRRMNTTLMVIFAAIALLLVIVGVGGVLSYAVAERTQEIGVRMALGAQRTDILRMILRHLAVWVIPGLLAGLAGSAALSRVIRGLLYGVTPTDVWAYVVVSLVLVAAAFVAAYLPARRAMSVDPIVALRAE